MLTFLLFYKQILEFIFSKKAKRNYEFVTASNVLDFVTLSSLVSWLVIDYVRWRPKIDRSQSIDAQNG